MAGSTRQGGTDVADDGDSFDYVVVGAGAAGSVLECGPPDQHPYIHIPAGFIKMLFNPTYTWQFQTEPGDGIGGRRIPTTQGRTLGGSSSINGMIYNRGQRADFDHWAQRGNRGWGYTDVLPYFKRTERRVGIADDRIHGRDGNLPVTDNDWIHPVNEAFIAGAQELGIPRSVDYNSGDRQEGVGYYQRAINRGFRHSAARMFLHPARSTGRLDVRTDARAARVLFDGTRAVGVEYVDDRDRKTRTRVYARKEVILSSGTANTAKLLQMSGIGPAGLLGTLGVPVLADLPVGENFRDHYSVRVVARVKNARTINELAVGTGLIGQPRGQPVDRALVLEIRPRDGPARPPGRVQPRQLQGRIRRIARRFPRHDLRRLAAPAGKHGLCPRALDGPVPGSRHPTQLPDRSDGPPSPAQGFAAGALAAAHARPGAVQYGSTAYHLIGTARMGPASDKTAVVDDELRVHGIQGLRCVDASIMPNMPSANTYSSTMMIAEKASDMIRGRPPLPPVPGVPATV
jgi:choline dehydrogenase